MTKATKYNSNENNNLRFRFKNTKIYTKLFWCIFTLFWMILIFLYSSQNGSKSSSSSSELTHFILNALTQLGIISACNISLEDFVKSENIIRTLAHFTEYLIFGVIVFEFTYRTFDFRKFKYFVIPLLFCALYAVSDEIHQYFVPGRAMQLIDWAVDTSGSFISIFVLFLFLPKKMDR